MIASRIKNPGLATQVDAGLLDWYRYLSPITEYYASQLSPKDCQGKKVAYWGHITFQNSATMMLPLKKAGVELVVGACNVDSTDDAMAAYLVAHGIQVYGWQGMTKSEYQENLAIVRSFEADYLCDMGGELCVAYLDKQPPVKRRRLHKQQSTYTRLVNEFRRQPRRHLDRPPGKPGPPAPGG